MKVCSDCHGYWVKAGDYCPGCNHFMHKFLWNENIDTGEIVMSTICANCNCLNHDERAEHMRPPQHCCEACVPKPMPPGERSTQLMDLSVGEKVCLTEIDRQTIAGQTVHFVKLEGPPNPPIAWVYPAPNAACLYNSKCLNCNTAVNDRRVAPTDPGCECCIRRCSDTETIEREKKCNEAYWAQQREIRYQQIKLPQTDKDFLESKRQVNEDWVRRSYRDTVEQTPMGKEAYTKANRGKRPQVTTFTPESLLEFHKLISDQARQVMKAKNTDYCGIKNDPFANFRSSAEVSGVEEVRGILQRIADKMSRLRTYLDTGKLMVKDEGVENIGVDTINYMILILAYIADQKALNASTQNTISGIATTGTTGAPIEGRSNRPE